MDEETKIFIGQTLDKIRHIAGDYATEHLGGPETACHRPDKWAELRHAYFRRSVDNLSTVLALLATMDLDEDLPESPAPPKHLR